jgi:TPR repeat protein
VPGLHGRCLVEARSRSNDGRSNQIDRPSIALGHDVTGAIGGFMSAAGAAGAASRAAAQAAAVGLLASLGHDGQHPAPDLTPPAGGDGTEAGGVRVGGVLALVSPGPAPVGVADLQRLAGVATVERARAACFAAGGYDEAAASWGARAGLALFTLTGHPLEAAPVGALAQAWVGAPEREGTLRREAVAGDTTAMRALAADLAARSRLTEATVWWRRAVTARDPQAWDDAATGLRSTGAVRPLQEWCRDFAEQGLPAAMLELASLHRAAGETEAETHWLTRCLEAGCTERAGRLGELHEAAGRAAPALAAYRVAAEAGDAAAGRHVARLLRADDPAAAEEVLRRHADGGDLDAGHDLAALLVTLDRPDEALGLLRQAADLGHSGAAVALGRLLFGRGEADEGETWLRVAAEAGAADADEELTTVLVAQLESADAAGETETAQRWRAKLETLGSDRARLALGHRARRDLHLDEAVAYLRPVAEQGNLAAVLALGEVYLELDRAHEAYDWYLRAAQADHAEAMVRVGELLFGWNLHDKAVVWLEQARAQGHPGAAQILADRLDEVARRAVRMGDAEGAARFVARLRSLDTVPAFRLLAARAYEEHDDAEHEQWLRKAADAGDPESMADLGKLLWHSRGNADEAGEWCRRALAAEHWPALYVLDHLLPADGPAVQERRMHWLLAAEAGWLPALEWMLTRGADTDDERAHWAELAAEAGSAVAYVTLGRLALARQDRDAALRWFSMGADEDDRDAMHHLGLLHLEGGDTDEARRWFVDAATAEHRDSADQLVALLTAQAPPDRELVGLWERLFAAVSDKEEASVARILASAYDRRGEERAGSRLRRLAARLG